MQTPAFLLNFPLEKQQLPLSYCFRSLFAMGCSATAFTFAFFNRLKRLHLDAFRRLGNGVTKIPDYTNLPGHQPEWY